MHVIITEGRQVVRTCEMSAVPRTGDYIAVNRSGNVKKVACVTWYPGEVTHAPESVEVAI